MQRGAELLVLEIDHGTRCYQRLDLDGVVSPRGVVQRCRADGVTGVARGIGNLQQLCHQWCSCAVDRSQVQHCTLRAVACAYGRPSLQ